MTGEKQDAPATDTDGAPRATSGDVWTVNLGGVAIAGGGAIALTGSLPFLGIPLGLASLAFAATAALTTLVGTRIHRQRLLPWTSQARLWTIAFAGTGLIASALSAGLSAATGTSGKPEIFWIYWPLATPIFAIYLVLSTFVGRARNQARSR